MLDIGWPELFLIAVVTIIVVGPKELPRVVRTVNGAIRKIRSLAGEFQSTLDDMVREADLEDIKKEIERASTVDVADEFKATVDPSGTLDGAFDFDDSSDDEKTILASPQGTEAGTGTSVAESEVSENGQAEAPPVVPEDVDTSADDTAERRSGT